MNKRIAQFLAIPCVIVVAVLTAVGVRRIFAKADK